MSKKFPKISVIIPVFNVEQYVNKCLESIVSQSYPNLEIIIIDDGSTDNSRYICKKHSKRDKRIKLIYQKNVGLSGARNRGIDIAKGEFLSFIDSDDWIESDMISTLYKINLEYESDISVCNFRRIYEEDIVNLNSVTIAQKNSDIVVLEETKKIEALLNNDYLVGNMVWNKLFKRHLFSKVRFPVGKIYEDTYVLHELYDCANKIAVSNEIKYNYCQRIGSISRRSFNIEMVDYIDGCIERHKYISEHYPILECKSRSQIFTSLLDIMQLAYSGDSIDKYKIELARYVDIVRNYDFTSCDLPDGYKTLLALLFDNVEKYIFVIKNLAHIIPS